MSGDCYVQNIMFTNITSQLRHPLKWILNFYTGRLCYSLPTIYAFLCKPSIIVEDREWNEISVFLKTAELWKSCQWKDISGMLPLYTLYNTLHMYSNWSLQYFVWWPHHWHSLATELAASTAIQLIDSIPATCTVHVSACTAVHVTTVNNMIVHNIT